MEEPIEVSIKKIGDQESFADAIGSTVEEMEDALKTTSALLARSEGEELSKSDMIKAIAETKFQEKVKINMALSLGMTIGMKTSISGVMGLFKR